MAANIEHYLGLANYFRAFIPMYQTVVGALESKEKLYLGRRTATGLDYSQKSITGRPMLAK